MEKIISKTFAIIVLCVVLVGCVGEDGKAWGHRTTTLPLGEKVINISYMGTSCPLITTTMREVTEKPRIIHLRLIDGEILCTIKEQ